MSGLKILLADDHREFLEVASRFLADHRGIDVVGSARSGKEAVQMAKDLSPDLVLMDLSMPDLNGLEATRRIKALKPPPMVVMLTLYDAPEIQSCARAAGADHFITKSDFGDSLPPLLVRLFPGLSFAQSGACAKTYRIA
jgi:DNA-binding NarL/FixJ family response regulator